MDNKELIELNDAIRILLAKKECIEAYISKGDRFNEVDYKLPQAIIRVLDELGRYENIEFNAKRAYDKGRKEGYEEAEFEFRMNGCI